MRTLGQGSPGQVFFANLQKVKLYCFIRLDIPSKNRTFYLGFVKKKIKCQDVANKLRGFSYLNAFRIAADFTQ